jgi:cyclopropane fatty-acyl-phospholipid synthase-like methyltransferase
LKSHLQHQWFETFFQGPAVEFWTNAMTPALTLADVDFLEKTSTLKPGTRLLDVPCGNGRHSIELARRGYRITGIDCRRSFWLPRALSSTPTGDSATCGHWS